MNEVEVIKENRVGLLNKEASKRTVAPIYVWRTGRTFYLSKKERCVADTFLETRSYAECSRELLKMGVRKNWLTCRRWLERPHIKEYMAEQFEERGMAAGWSKEHWLVVMTKHLKASADYESARDEIKIYEGDLGRKGDDPGALIGMARARERMNRAMQDRLAPGDLYGMRLIASVLKFEMPDHLNITQINFMEGG